MVMIGGAVVEEVVRVAAGRDLKPDRVDDDACGLHAVAHIGGLRERVAVRSVAVAAIGVVADAVVARHDAIAVGGVELSVGH